MKWYKLKVYEQSCKKAYGWLYVCSEQCDCVFSSYDGRKPATRAIAQHAVRAGESISVTMWISGRRVHSLAKME